jgi:hypothetical protein
VANETPFPFFIKTDERGGSFNTICYAYKTPTMTMPIETHKTACKDGIFNVMDKALRGAPPRKEKNFVQPNGERSLD